MLNKIKKIIVGIFVFIIGTLSKVFADVNYQPDYGVKSESKTLTHLEELKWIVLPIIFFIGIIVIIKKCIKKGKTELLAKISGIIAIISILAIITCSCLLLSF